MNFANAAPSQFLAEDVEADSAPTNSNTFQQMLDDAKNYLVYDDEDANLDAQEMVSTLSTETDVQSPMM